ncbi:uncharacterized protein JCM15063_001393 [Sporobolomyces koalae]|uniref:uncharacterized protein n=1 Tax=Sporobolomyces koalae TaxID=500713 RepID=UPI003179F8BB
MSTAVPLPSPTTSSILEKSPSRSSSSSPSTTPLENAEMPTKAPGPGRDLRFWLVFLSICCSLFLSALDLTAISTALPSIAADLRSGSDYSWVGSAYTLSSTALIPVTLSIATIVGRRPVMLGSIGLFAIGSAVCGSAQSMPIMILGRTIQGAGGGAILAVVEIIVVDLVPIAERGIFFGIIGMVWAMASAIGPPLAGALASRGAWRWLFYLNLPVCGLALILVFFFLRVKAPKTTFREKLDQIDWFTALFVAAATSAIIGLTWGGVTYSWSSPRVLVPLILGLVGIVVYIYLERFAKHPVVPFSILSTRTAIAGYVTTFLHGIIVLAVLYFLPVYFQANKGQTAVESGVSTFSLSFTIAPMAIFAGIIVQATGHYWAQNVVGWILATVGLGLMTLIKADSSKGAWVGYPAMLGLGLGLLYSGTNFAVLAPVTPREQPFATALYAFVRAFGQVFGIAIGSTILQNRLSTALPPAFAEQFGSGGEIAFAAIPVIRTLNEPLRTEVETAFADSIRTIWIAMTALAAVGFLTSLLIKSLPLSTEVDEAWGLERKEKVSDEAKA